LIDDDLTELGAFGLGKAPVAGVSDDDVKAYYTTCLSPQDSNPIARGGTVDVDPIRQGRGVEK